MSLRKHKQDWEELGNMDPYWAILSHPNREFGKWDIKEFFLTGDKEIERVIESAIQLGYPLERDLVLDFGCGVGRLTRALAKYFQQCYGVDISESMIVRAKELNRFLTNCEFILNNEDHLQMFSDIVLQHIPNKYTIKYTISVLPFKSDFIAKMVMDSPLSQ